jgi:hypothetical protein
VTPLRVVFYMRTPVALGFPWIFFDSLLAHVALREELGERYFSLPTKTPVDRIPELPLKKWRDVYVASVSIFEPETEMAVYQFYKRGDFPFPRGKIRRGSGFFKDFIIRAAYVPAHRVVFYATGEFEAVRRLAAKVSALGKERNVGFGAVKGVSVEEVEEEWGLVRDGLAMRPIPVRLLKRYEDAAYLAYKPPYWAKESVELCAVPFTHVELA